jgi:hypothetical protein
MFAPADLLIAHASRCLLPSVGTIQTIRFGLVANRKAAARGLLRRLVGKLSCEQVVGARIRYLASHLDADSR